MHFLIRVEVQDPYGSGYSSVLYRTYIPGRLASRGCRDVTHAEQAKRNHPAPGDQRTTGSLVEQLAAWESDGPAATQRNNTERAQTAAAIVASAGAVVSLPWKALGSASNVLNKVLRGMPDVVRVEQTHANHTILHCVKTRDDLRLAIKDDARSRNGESV